MIVTRKAQKLLGMAAIFAAILLITYIGARTWEAGRQGAISDVIEEVDDAVSEADSADLSRIECMRINGMRWNFSTGECERVTRGAR